MQSLKKALDKALKSAGVDKAVAQTTALIIWNSVVGTSIAENTEPASVEHGVITVKTSTPTWRQELQFKKKEIVEKLNHHLGKNIIRDIRFI